LRQIRASRRDVTINVSASGTPTTTGGFFAKAMPPLRIEDFNFASLSN